MSKLILKSGGILERETWNTETRSYDHKEVSDTAYAYLNDIVEFDEIVLKDLFIVINKNLEIISPIFGNWIEENTRDALNLEPIIKEHCQNDNMEYVEIYWRLGIDEDGIDFPAWPSFHGIGTADEDDDYYKAGQIIRWGVDFTPVQDLVNLPFKINPITSLCITEGEGKNLKCEVKEYKSGSVTLYQVIQAVIWELSWWGGPDGKETYFDELVKGALDDIENGDIYEM